jgi:uroporphyrinogen-III synthase
MVLITRPLKESIKLAQVLDRYYIENTIFPTLEIKALHPVNNNHYQVIIFISKNAVKYGAYILDKQQDYLLLAVGKATANALESLGYNVDYYPQHNPSSQALLELDAVKNIKNKNVLIVRGKGGVETLKNELGKHNNVDYLEVYERLPNSNALQYQENLAQFHQAKEQIVIITSIDIFTALCNFTTLDKNTKCVVASQRIANYLQNLGFCNIIITSMANEEIVLGVKKWLN